MSITIVHTLPEGEWSHFVEEHPAGNIFHTPEMFQVFSRTKGYQPELWAATEDGRVLALLLPVRVTLKDGLLRHFTTRAVVYGSVLCAPGTEGQEALARLMTVPDWYADGGPLVKSGRVKKLIVSVPALSIARVGELPIVKALQEGQQVEVELVH